MTVTVKNGVLTLDGTSEAEHSLVAVAVRLAWSVDGVVKVTDEHQASQATG